LGSIVVSISDAKVTAAADATLVTYSLGSCIGVALYDPVVRVAGMLHFQLPSASMDANRAKEAPLMFADTGLAALLAAMEAEGAQKRRMRVKLAGGAQMLNDATVFNIGRRNHAAVRKVLWQHGMLIDAEDVGGGAPRNLYLRAADGETTVRMNNELTLL
jgi:chemotaxis protein CheD